MVQTESRRLDEFETLVELLPMLSLSLYSGIVILGKALVKRKEGRRVSIDLCIQVGHQGELDNRNVGLREDEAQRHIDSMIIPPLLVFLDLPASFPAVKLRS